MSKITAIELYNFMTVKEGRLEFDDSNVLNLVGYNDSGKSSVTRALEVLLYDAYSNDQVNFIRDDEDMFGVGLEFDDGVAINKYKYATGQSEWEMLKDGKTLYTNRLESGIASISGVPEVIQNYLGVVKDDITGTYLNVRRNSDKAFLVQTTGGDNYKILNSILRADILANTVKKLNEDRNKLQVDINSNSITLNTLKGELESIRVLPDEFIGSLKTLTKVIRDNKSKVDALLNISDKEQAYNGVVVWDEVKPVDISNYMLLETVVEAYNATLTVIPDELSTLDVDRLSILESIVEAKKGLDIVIPDSLPVVDTSKYDLISSIMEYSTSLDTYIGEELDLIDIEKLNLIRNVGEAFNTLYHETNTLTSVETQHREVLSELKTLSVQHGFQICKSCGTVVEFEEEHAHG